MIKRILFIVAWLLVLGAWGMAGRWVWEWLPERQERALLEIKAHRVSELAEPVFAQFVYTQTLDLPDLALVSGLQVPIFVPETGRSLEITLLRDGEAVESWETPGDASGLVEVDLPFEPPLLLEGEMDLVFDGGSIAHADQEFAPRLFIESFDAAYPGGNYRIAENEKEGDISLSINEIVTNQEVLAEKYDINPVGTVASWLLWLTGLVVVSLFPFAVLRTVYAKQSQSGSSGSDRDEDPEG